MKTALVLLAVVVAVFTTGSDSRMPSPYSSGGHDDLDNQDEHVPAELDGANAGGESNDRPQVINSSYADQQFDKERMNLHVPELRGKKQDKILKQLENDLAHIKYNLTYVDSGLKSIRDNQNNLTDIGKELKVELQTMKERQNSYTGIGKEIISKLDAIIVGQACPTIVGYFLFSNQCFKYLNETRRKRTDADAECRSLGLTLAQPRDPIGLRKYMMTNLGTNYHIWLGGRGTGSALNWQRGGQVISSSLSFWYPGQPGRGVTSAYGLLMLGHPNNLKAQPNKPYYSWGLTNVADTLCEKV